jgi:hypothetical protein
MNKGNGAAGESRFTMGLAIDVFEVLDRHGYRPGSKGDIGRAIGHLFAMCDAYQADPAEDTADDTARSTKGEPSP